MTTAAGRNALPRDPALHVRKLPFADNAPVLILISLFVRCSGSMDKRRRTRGSAATAPARGSLSPLTSHLSPLTPALTPAPDPYPLRDTCSSSALLSPSDHAHEADQC